MNKIEVEGATVELDREGFLRDLHQWSRQVAVELARREQIDLGDEHWEIIDLLRSFYKEYKVSPAMRILVKQAGIKLGREKGSSLHLLRLFPGSPAKVASKIAGLPKPTNCL
ncbi:TusE/DsrC/DsvC family sulfur relay protein [Motiliproteus sp. SC1-56]|uniref:TusE/DsrC/DsvC family sulfur relay protein n=1 Tax=Motiliproteus sp. SC1-56 TaxID=2799565 RepID=UPI001A8EAA0D|nr:TusE/DsrC/DsvC family sulfur relay protein [Motiliproteus sp. SC1-56]